MKSLVGTLSAELQKILSCCILTEQYPATTIAFQFTILELDSDILQSMINCASLALYKSDISSRCLPVAITMYLLPGDKRKGGSNPSEWLLLDPTLSQIKNSQAYSHKQMMVWNVDTNELISQSLTPLGRPSPLELKELEIITGVSQSIAKNLHSFMIEL